MCRKCKQKYCHLVNPGIPFSGFLEKAEATLHPRDQVSLLLLGRGEHKGPRAGLRSAKAQRVSGWAGAVHGHQEGRAAELGPAEDALTASHRAALVPWSFSNLEFSWPVSRGPSGTLLLSVLFGRFLLLEASPAEEPVKPSKSLPSDAPMNSVKE